MRLVDTGNLQTESCARRTNDTITDTDSGRVRELYEDLDERLQIHSVQRALQEDGLRLDADIFYLFGIPIVLRQHISHPLPGIHHLVRCDGGRDLCDHVSEIQDAQGTGTVCSVGQSKSNSAQHSSWHR